MTISIAIGAIVAVIGIICLVELDIPIRSEGIGITVGRYEEEGVGLTLEGYILFFLSAYTGRKYFLCANQKDYVFCFDGEEGAKWNIWLVTILINYSVLSFTDQIRDEASSQFLNYSIQFLQLVFIATTIFWATKYFKWYKKVIRLEWEADEPLRKAEEAKRKTRETEEEARRKSEEAEREKQQETANNELEIIKAEFASNYNLQPTTKNQTDVRLKDGLCIENSLGDKFSGIVIENHKDVDQIYNITCYVEGQKEMIELSLYPDGSKKRQTKYTANNRHGVETRYYQNSKIESETPFVEGVMHGEGRKYSENGNIERVYIYKYGELIESN